MTKKILILASASPRRRQLLALGGWTFNIVPADVDETPFPDERPGDYVVRLSEAKARAVGAASPAGIMVVAADTTVADGRIILGKPANAEEAFAMLQSLRNRTHKVFTGIAVYAVDTDQVLTDLGETDVPMRNYSDAEIETYIATGDPFDKAGGYAIQHPGFHPVDDLSGCYANVVGLPLCHLTRLLKQFGVETDIDVPTACQNDQNYSCQVFSSILKENE